MLVEYFRKPESNFPEEKVLIKYHNFIHEKINDYLKVCNKKEYNAFIEIKDAVSSVYSKSFKVVGCFVAFKDNNNKVYIGWSKCNSEDKWNKNIAKELAKKRAIKYFNKNIKNIDDKVPYDIFPSFIKFIFRSINYYKSSVVYPEWVKNINNLYCNLNN